MSPAVVDRAEELNISARTYSVEVAGGAATLAKARDLLERDPGGGATKALCIEIATNLASRARHLQQLAETLETEVRAQARGAT